MEMNEETPSTTTSPTLESRRPSTTTPPTLESRRPSATTPPTLESRRPSTTGTSIETQIEASDGNRGVEGVEIISLIAKSFEWMKRVEGI